MPTPRWLRQDARLAVYTRGNAYPGNLVVDGLRLAGTTGGRVTYGPRLVLADEGAQVAPDVPPAGSGPVCRVVRCFIEATLEHS